MSTPRRGFALVAPALVISLSAFGCTAGAGPSPTPSPTPPPTPSPAPTATTFTLDVQPAMAVGRTIGGSRFVFLVTVGGNPADGPVAITASVKQPSDRMTMKVEPANLIPGTVGEVTIEPAATTGEAPLDVTITAKRGSVERTELRTLTVVEGTDTLAEDAAAHLAPFIDWLAVKRPDLGITKDTKWHGTPGSWVLVVNHYLYFSDEWELDLDWHVMIAPDDWSRICLRKRFQEVKPSAAFEISSVSARTEPHEIQPPEAVWR